MTQTPSGSLHYLGFGVNPMSGGNRVLGEVTTVCFPKYETFDPNPTRTVEEDNGHTGTDTLLLGKDRTVWSASPSFTDKIRLAEGFEDWMFLLLGKHDTPTKVESEASTAYRWKIYRDVSDPLDLPWATLKQGFNWSTAKAESYIEAMVNSIELTLDADKSPTYTANFLSNHPEYNKTEPTRVFPSTEYKFKANQGKIYIGASGSTINQLKALNPLDCYSAANLSISNGLEVNPCGGTPFGQVDKDVNPLTANGSITMDYNENNMDLEAEYVTGSSSGTSPTEEGLFKAILIEYIGKKIETVGSNHYYMTLQIYMPRVEITDVTSPRAGAEKKTITLTFDLVTNQPTVNPIEIHTISPMSAIHYGTSV